MKLNVLIYVHLKVPKLAFEYGWKKLENPLQKENINNDSYFSKQSYLPSILLNGLSEEVSGFEWVANWE